MAVSAPLILTVGIPGSGKSTWAAALVAQKALQQERYQIISTDSIRAQLYGDEAIQGEWMEIRSALIHQLASAYQSILQRQTTAVIYDATNAVRRQRREFIQLARQCGYAPLTAAWIDTPLVVCLQRNAVRSRQVPPHIIEKMQRRLAGAPPTRLEDLDEIVKVQNAWTKNA